MIAVSVHGAEGRMGRLVTGLAEDAPDMQLAALFTEPQRAAPAGTFHDRLPLNGQGELGSVHPRGGVIIDFSVASALGGLLVGARQAAAPLVIGTTGYSPEQREQLHDFAQQGAVVYAANFSLGIPALQLVLQLLARSLPQGFQAEQIETHHRRKLDRPSGTARVLAETWQQARGGDPVPVHSQRLGGIVGEHVWTISDDEETMQLVHRAHSRRAFLRGILPAIRFVATAKPGLYSLTDVLQAQAGLIQPEKG